jgi:hypothetical protein
VTACYEGVTYSKALNWPAPAASTKATQPGQPDRIDIMYAQNTPTPEAARRPEVEAQRQVARLPQLAIQFVDDGRPDLSHIEPGFLVMRSPAARSTDDSICRIQLTQSCTRQASTACTTDRILLWRNAPATRPAAARALVGATVSSPCKDEPASCPGSRRMEGREQSHASAGSSWLVVATAARYRTARR